MTAHDLTFTESTPVLALAARADSVVEDVEMQLPHSFGHGRVFFRHDGETTTYCERHGHETFAGDDFAAEIIGAVVDFADDDLAWADRVMTREECRDVFGDAWVTALEARQMEGGVA